MNTKSEELLARDVREEFKKSRSYFRVARALDIKMTKVKEILGEELPPLTRREAQFGGRGRPELQKYIVATKHVDKPWDNNTPAIAEAREDYEIGTHEMTTGRDGDTLILYSIPRVNMQPRPNFFDSRSI